MKNFITIRENMWIVYILSCQEKIGKIEIQTIISKSL